MQHVHYCTLLFLYFHILCTYSSADHALTSGRNAATQAIHIFVCFLTETGSAD